MLIMETADTSAVVQRFGADCPPDQQYRELTQNSMDSILRSGRPGEVFWTFETIDGVRKLCIIDNGIGMLPQEVRKHINRLGSSGGTIADTANFGIGAKISAGVRNPAGVEYQVWEGGAGHRLLFHKDGSHYGLFEYGSGKDAYWEALPPSARPKEIRESGVKVILHGSGPDHDTWLESRAILGTKLSEDGDHTGHWLTKYLNTRYWEVPDSVTLSVREQKTADENETKRRVRGEKYFLERDSEAHGHVDVPGARVHWFVMPQKQGGGGERYTTSPLVAGVFQNELYDLRVGTLAHPSLRNAGVFMNIGRVTLVFEPDPSIPVHANNTRTSLNVDGQPLPYAQWEEEFSKALPDAILKLLEDLRIRDKSKDANKKIHDIVSQTAPKRVVNRKGREKAGDPDGEQAHAGSNGGGGSGENPDDNDRDGGDPPPGAGPTRPEGDSSRASRVKKFPIPDIVWVSASPPKGWDWVKQREQGEIEDEAGCYVPSIRKIKMNADFRPIMTFIENLKKEYKSSRVPDSYIANKVHHWIETRVKEMVAHVLAWQGSSRTWADISKRLTDGHITAAALSFREAEAECRKAIHTRFRPKVRGRGRYVNGVRPAGPRRPSVTIQ